MIESTAIEFDVINHTFRQIDISEIDIDYANLNKIYWIHCDLNQQMIYQELINKLQLPDDIVALIKQPDSVPQLIDNDVNISMKIPALINIDNTKSKELEYGNLIFHLTSHFCFTATYESIPAIAEFIKNSPKTVQYAKTPCFILFLMLDDIVSDYAKILFNYEVAMEEMDVCVRSSHSNIYNEVMDAKLQVMKIKRFLIATREILLRLSGRKIAVISARCAVYLNNLSNHTHMVAHESDSIRDMLNGLLDQIENALMQKLNETMRILTAFTAIFLPLSLITGIYGMNFHWMPELSWKYGYFFTLALIAICAGVLLYIFKKKKLF